MNILVRPSTLYGQVRVQGSKNGAMMCIPIACATGASLSNVPDTADIRNFHALLKQNGVKIYERCLHFYTYDASRVTELVSGPSDIRHATLLLGLGCALGVPVKLSVELGGCSIGLRKFDMHIEALRKLGARIEQTDCDICLYPERLVGADVEFYYPTFSGTVNVILAAMAARGTTHIQNAAINPEVVDAARFLHTTGTHTRYISYRCLAIRGGFATREVHHGIVGDRVVVATLMAGALATGGRLEITGVPAEHLMAEIQQWRRAGANIRTDGETVNVFPSRLHGTDLDTGAYPDFHSDVQALYGATMLNANGVARIRDWIYDDRYRYCHEMKKLKARITVEDGDYLCVNGEPGKVARIRGRGDRPVLQGATVRALDIRGGAALVVAGMIAEGETVIENAEVIDRGYEDIVGLFRRVGAEIERVVVGYVR